MTLARLVFECVRDSITLPKQSLSYASFTSAIADGEKIGQQWAMQLSGVFGALNLGISRLLDSGKIPFSHDEVTIVGNVFEFTKGHIYNVAVKDKDGYSTLGFRTLEAGKKYMVIGNPRLSTFKATVEYRKRIPHLDWDAPEDPDTLIKKVTDGEDGYNDPNIDLEEAYGIDSRMCAYLKEFVAAQLTENLDPLVANNHNTRAEQYFDGIASAETSFYQSSVANVFGRYW